MEICPKCGAPGYRRVEPRGGKYRREYVFMVHETREGDKRSIKKCYLGPLEGYIHAERLHSLQLTNLAEQDYLEVIMRAVEKYVERVRSTSAKCGEEKARALLLEASKKLVRFSKALAKIAEELRGEAEAYREVS